MNSIKRNMLVRRDSQPCPYCGYDMDIFSVKRRPTRDHIRSKHRFPTNGKQGRLIVVCSECNYLKGDMTLSEFIAAIKAKNDEFMEYITVNNQRLIHLKYLLQVGLEGDSNA